MLSSLRHSALRRPLALVSSNTRSLSISTPFRPTRAAYSAVKPGSESEATTPGAGSTEDIANSNAAYDGRKTDPDSSTAQVEQETDADFGASSANRETSRMATQAQHQSDRRPSKQQQETPDRTDFGASKARKQHGGGPGSAPAH